MEVKDYIIFSLCFLCLLVCYAGYSIVEQCESEKVQFVLGENSKYCYPEGNHTKNLKVFAKFDSLEQCNNFLKEAFILSR